MRAVLVTVVAGGALAALASAFASTAGLTSLRITYWEDSAEPRTSVSWTLRCNPARGTLPRSVVACKRLAAAGSAKLFAPARGGLVCTQIYGGPQRARIVGTVNGRRVGATFARTNGCEIDRWKQISPWLVPAGGVTS